MAQHDTLARRSQRRRVVPPPTETVGAAVEADDLVVLAPNGWDHGERQVHHARSVIRAGRSLRLVDDLGMAVSVGEREQVLVTSRAQKVFWMQKLARSLTALSTEVERIGGSLSGAVIGFHLFSHDDPFMRTSSRFVELTAWSEFVFIGVNDSRGRPVVDLRRDWALLRSIELPRAPVTTVLPGNKGIQSALDAARLGKTVRRKAQAYLDPHRGSAMVRVAGALSAGAPRVADVFVWDEDRAASWRDRLEADGWEVRLETEEGQRGGRRIAQEPSAVIVFDLDARPAESLRTARWLLELGPGRTTPMVFVDGTERARSAVRKTIPLGRFCAGDELSQVLASV